MVFFAMSVADYELMAYNMQELRRYIREMKEVIIYYRKVTTDETETENQSQNGQTSGNDGKQSTPGG